MSQDFQQGLPVYDEHLSLRAGCFSKAPQCAFTDPHTQMKILHWKQQNETFQTTFDMLL